MTAPSLADAAAGMEEKMEPPQEKTTSVPVSYQPEIRVCSSAEGEKEAPYCQVKRISTCLPSLAAASLAP
jgi:hypothetical protein